MEVKFGLASDIDAWMELVEGVKHIFPGLETRESLQEHKKTVLEFMEQRQAICVKNGNAILGAILFSKSHNMICFLAVLPQYRKQGVGSKLLEAALGELNREKDITVSTFRADDEKGIAPRALYKKFGFVEGDLTNKFDYPNQILILGSR